MKAALIADRHAGGFGLLSWSRPFGTKKGEAKGKQHRKSSPSRGKRVGFFTRAISGGKRSIEKPKLSPPNDSLDAPTKFD